MNQPEPSEVRPAMAHQGNAQNDSRDNPFPGLNRKKFYVRSVTGIFARWRWILVWITQIVFYGLPWIEWNGRQAVLFHLVERKFYLFGWVFWPQDVIFLSLILIIAAYALFLFTAIAGRLWCGYACPQTVYTEIFLWIEAKIEGDHGARAKLDKQPMDGRKCRIRAAKYSAWIAFSLWTGFTFVGYFTPIKELLRELFSLGMGPWEMFWVVFYSLATYANAGFLRDLMCTIICPYSRFQGVMFDPDTLIVTYDAERGEPRGARGRNVDYKSRGLGECVDCGICIQVCPTGIDIRDGLQYECIGCSACIDACDQVMDKVGYPRGLVRYSTERAMEKHWGGKEILSHVLRPRTLIYSGILFALIFGLVWGVATRVPLKVDVIRDRSTLAREADDGKIENIYRLQVMNTSEETRRFSISVSGLERMEVVSERIVEVPAGISKSVSVNVRAMPESGQKGANKIFFDVRALNHENLFVREKASFLIPQ